MAFRQNLNVEHDAVPCPDNHCNRGSDPVFPDIRHYKATQKGPSLPQVEAGLTQIQQPEQRYPLRLLFFSVRQLRTAAARVEGLHTFDGKHVPIAGLLFHIYCAMISMLHNLNMDRFRECVFVSRQKRTLHFGILGFCPCVNDCVATSGVLRFSVCSSA